MVLNLAEGSEGTAGPNNKGSKSYSRFGEDDNIPFQSTAALSL